MWNPALFGISELRLCLGRSTLHFPRSPTSTAPVLNTRVTTSSEVGRTRPSATNSKMNMHLSATPCLYHPTSTTDCAETTRRSCNSPLYWADCRQSLEPVSSTMKASEIVVFRASRSLFKFLREANSSTELVCASASRLGSRNLGLKRPVPADLLPSPT